MPGERRSAPLVSVAELVELLDAGSDHRPHLLDVRWSLKGPPGIEAYRAGHLPGSVFADLDRDLAAPPGRHGRHPLPTAAHVQAAMRRLGVKDDRPVVVYDDADASVAARAWWLLRYFRHSDVRVLDGGFAAWRAAGLPTEVGDPPELPRGDFTARPGGLPMLDADSAARLATRGVLLDARTEERFRGDVEPVDPVAGHVPGARSAPAAGNVRADGTFLSADELTARFAALGVTIGTPVGAYCGSGVTAAQTVLALDIVGVPSSLYVGSWSAWVADADRPVATGS
jgi:thiosulfate/3-mercaptopyruvate sulfurtransferase